MKEPVLRAWFVQLQQLRVLVEELVEMSVGGWVIKDVLIASASPLRRHAWLRNFSVSGLCMTLQLFTTSFARPSRRILDGKQARGFEIVEGCRKYGSLTRSLCASSLTEAWQQKHSPRMHNARLVVIQDGFMKALGT